MNLNSILEQIHQIDMLTLKEKRMLTETDFVNRMTRKPYKVIASGDTSAMRFATEGEAMTHVKMKVQGRCIMSRCAPDGHKTLFYRP